MNYYSMALMSGWAALLLLFVGTGIASAKEEAPPEKRSWTAASGHKVEATLVKYSDYEITLKLADGKEKAIAKEQFVPEDIAYLKDFPKLYAKAPPAKLPWIRMDAKIAARARDTGSRDHEASKEYVIEVSTREKQPMKAEVVQVWVAKKKNSTNAVKYFGLQRREVEIPAQKSTTFESGEGSAIAYLSYEVAGIICQVYWDGFLVDSYTSVGTESKLATEPNFFERVTIDP